MSKLADIRTLLLRLRLKLVADSGATGLTVGDPEFTRKIEELNRMSHTLGLAVRELKSAHHVTAAREQNLWNIPRDNRYGPTASVAGQQRDINELISEAAEIQRLVEKLIGRICAGNELRSRQYRTNPHTYRTVRRISMRVPKRQSSWRMWRSEVWFVYPRKSQPRFDHEFASFRFPQRQTPGGRIVGENSFGQSCSNPPRRRCFSSG